MKRKIQILFSSLFLLTSLSGQITITNAYFPQAGDTLRTVIDAMPSGVDLLSAGAENNWDFTDLAGITQETVVRAASDGEFFDQFPSADIYTGAANLNTGEFYFNVTDNAYEALGYVGPDPANFGINIIARLVPPMAERRAPMNFFDVNTQDNNIQVALSTDLLPGGILDSLPFSADSIRFRIASERLDVVDSWGTLSIPGGTYDVLREKRTQEQETRLDIFVSGPLGGWFDVTDFAGLDFLGKDTTITYNFFSNDAKEPVAVITVDPITDDPVSVQYKSNNISTSARYVDKGDADIFAYPNPAINDVRFDFINLPMDTYDLKIYNILGVEVFRQRYRINNRRTVKLNISDMRKGTYLYTLLDSRGKPVTTKRLVIIKP